MIDAGDASFGRPAVFRRFCAFLSIDNAYLLAYTIGSAGKPANIFTGETKVMKKFVKIFCAALALVLCAASFAACGEKEPDSTSDSTPDASSSTPAQDASSDTTDTSAPDDSKKVLKMGTNAEFPPYEYYDNEKIVGIDVEIAAAIADKLGMELVIEDMKFDSIIASVVSGGVDIGVAGMTVTDKRLESVNFSSSYATGIQSVIVKEGSDIKSLDDLNGKKIGVQLVTTGDIFASEDFGEDNVIKYAKGADAVLALIGGDVDAVIIDNEPAKVFVQSNTGLTLLETDYAIEEYAIAVAKDNTELLDAINGALETLIADGTIDTILAKYISAE